MNAPVTSSMRRIAWAILSLISRGVASSGILRIPVGARSLGQRLGGFLSGHQDFFLIRALDSAVPVVSLYRSAFGSYEPETTRLFQHLVQPGMTVVDVGAEIGHYTILGAMQVGAKGRVYAFEPDPHTLSTLRRNVECSGHSASVTIVPVAVADEPGAATLYLGKSGTTSLLNVAYEQRDSVTVERTTLDQFFQELGWPQVDVVKMDIEGAEKFALKGMKELVQRNPDLKLIVEFCPDAIQDTGGTPTELCDALLDAGFGTFWLISDELVEVHLPEELPELTAKTIGVANLLCKGDEAS